MLRVLLIDDEESLHFAFHEFLRARGHAADSARSAEEAFERLSSHRYDAVVVDLRLSGFDDTDGLRVVARARRDHPETRIVVLSACGADLEPAALSAGADRFLQKPQPLSRIVALIDALATSPAGRSHG